MSILAASFSPRSAFRAPRARPSRQIIMTTIISDDTIDRIAHILGVPPIREGNHVRYEIAREDPQRRLILEVYPSLPIGDTEGALITLFTPNAHLQLQHCSGVAFSDMMGEVTFVGESGGKISGLIVEREGACSLYSNVDRHLLSGDFTTLGPEIMMSSIALSLGDVVLPDDDAFPTGESA
jgi:hypothetical protein